MNSSKIQNLFGPHPLTSSHSSPLPSSSRFRIWISGSQMLQCPLTPRLSRTPLSPSSPHTHSSLLAPHFIDLPHTFSLYCLSIWMDLFFFCFLSFSTPLLFHTASSLSQVTQHFPLSFSSLPLFF